MKSTMTAATLTFSLIAFAGCATSGATKAKQPAPPTVELPQRVAGTVDLSSLESHEIQMLQREQEVLLKVRLCVSPKGTVDNAKLVETSGHQSYDAAVIASVRAWKYRSYAADKDMRVCKTVRITYHAG